MSDAAARRALAAWGMEAAEITAPLVRENIVYRVVHDGAAYALRLHRPGLRTEAELRSELVWMAMLASAGLSVPAPVRTRAGDVIAVSDAGFVSLLTWLPGAQMGEAGAPLAVADPVAAFAALGEAMARLHELSDAWTPPQGFFRPRWDADGLLGAAPLWGRFWEAPFLGADDRDFFVAARDRAKRRLAGLDDADFGLIHADLLRENVLIHEGRPQLLDFDDAGWGFRLFDVATSLLKHRREPIYPAIEAALLSGYRRRRPLDAAALPLFMALRAFTYVGWIAERMAEPGAEARAARLLADARDLARASLDENGS